jgi:hypothetical protein
VTQTLIRGGRLVDGPADINQGQTTFSENQGRTPILFLRLCFATFLLLRRAAAPG